MRVTINKQNNESESNLFAFYDMNKQLLTDTQFFCTTVIFSLLLDWKIWILSRSGDCFFIK